MSDSFPSADTIHRVELPNGIAVLAYENPTSPAVIVAGSAWAGAINEPAAQAGLARFTAAMLMRGTETRTFAQINEQIESVGAQLSVHAGVHTAGFGGKSLAGDLGLLLEVLADVLRNPTFPPGEVDTLRGQILTDLERRQHDTRRLARLVFDELLYPDHPYGRSVNGYTETVRGLERNDLLRFYRDHYTPRGAIVTVVGAIPAEEAVARVHEALGDWQAPLLVPNTSVPPRVTLGERRAQHVPIPGKTQSDIVLGWPGMARNDLDFMAGALANTVLGVFGMMGRLGDTVRDLQGLAYYVYSRLEAGLGAGPWLANAGVDPANVERAVEGILEQVRRLRDEPVPADEFADSQAYLTGSMPLRLETNEGVAGAILEMERYGLGLDYLLRYQDLVRAVTPEQAREVARVYLDPETYVVATAGPGG